MTRNVSVIMRPAAVPVPRFIANATFEIKKALRSRATQTKISTAARGAIVLKMLHS